MNRNDFKILDKVVYLDSAAGTLKPSQVIQKIAQFYNDYPINPHSTDSPQGIKVMKEIINARNLVAELIDASNNEIIFTSGTTDSLNRTAQMFKVFLKKDDEVVISKYNHSSNIIPWIEICKEKDAKVIFSDNLFDDINVKTKIVCYSQENNSLRQNIDIEKLYLKTKKHGAVLVNDAAQAIAHKKVSLHDADVIAFSGNKLYGPTGIGVLAIRKELMTLLKPNIFGGGATGPINGENWVLKDGVVGFEAGTLNTAGIIGLSESIKYFNNVDLSYEKEIANYAFDELSKISNITIYSRKGDLNIIFNINNINSHDVVSYLGNKGIILRSGAHCAHLIKEIICNTSTVRLSIAAYNNKEDIDKFIFEIKKGGDFIDFI